MQYHGISTLPSTAPKLKCKGSTFYSKIFHLEKAINSSILRSEKLLSLYYLVMVKEHLFLAFFKYLYEEKAI